MNSEHIGPINIGNPGEFTILELAQKVKAMTGSKSEIIYNPLPQDDPKQRQPDITKAQNLLGWNPGIALEVGLERTIGDFAQRMGVQTKIKSAL
jgi:UDP-glucuronate decarboxylase